MGFLKRFESVLFPYRCACCGEVLNSEGPCEECSSALSEQVITGKVCKYCGLEKKYCECKKYHYLFEGVAAPFYNRGMAQDGVYRLKFSYAPYVAEFFGRKMAETFKLRFSKEHIDAVCIVPTKREDASKRDYDYVALLAKHCAKELKLSLKVNLLKKVRKTERQHELSHDKRQANVKGAYKATKRLDGKIILLIDDIKTTGYTLNECSKQLRMAGAEKVYCLTALQTLNSGCKQSKNEV